MNAIRPYGRNRYPRWLGGASQAAGSSRVGRYAALRNYGNRADSAIEPGWQPSVKPLRLLPVRLVRSAKIESSGWSVANPSVHARQEVQDAIKRAHRELVSLMRAEM